MNNLEKDLESAMDESLKTAPPLPSANLRPLRPVGPRDVTNIVAEATHPDTGRATAKMVEQMKIIVQNLERELAQAEEVSAVVAKRISDLTSALVATKASLQVLSQTSGQSSDH
jgi:hypothetical protein